MYKVMIVDDEPLIREGLQTIIDWEDFGFEVCGTAVDSMDALSKLGELSPHLMVVDIRMPGHDGLELMKAVRERVPAMRFLILSGYADFDYAKRAITLGADGYMLKPVDEDELVEYLRTIRVTLASLRLDVQNVEHRRESWLQSLVTEDVGELPSASSLKQMDLIWQQYQVMLISAESNDEVNPQTRATLRKKVSEWVQDEKLGYAFGADPYIGVILRHSYKTELQLSLLRDKLDRAIRSEQERYFASIGTPVGTILQAKESYLQALHWMQRKFFFVEDVMASEHSREASGIEGGTANQDEIADKLTYALDIGSRDGAVQLLEQSAKAMIGSGKSEQEVKQAFVRIIGAAVGKYAQQHPDHGITPEDTITWLSDIHKQPNMKQLLRFVINEVERFLQQGRNDSSDSIVKRMTDLIHRNYGDPLKLESLADLFGYNSAYLGKLFKSTTGEYFNTYLDKVRIEEAKRLLEEGMKVYQVAERIGYSNVDYFHTKFKKYVGTSPSAYKKH